MAIPPELLYSSDHEWIHVTGDVARIGITDFAQDSLGDVVFVQEPSVGTRVAVGDTFTEVESTKSVSDIYAPVTGVIVSINPAVVAEPSLVNSDPYGDGWICEIRMDDTDVSHLLDATGYQNLIG